MRDEGGDGQSVDIRYKNAGIDDRMELKALFRNFHELVKQIADAQEQERQEDAEQPQRIVQRRPFGSGKNTRAAEEAATGLV